MYKSYLPMLDVSALLLSIPYIFILAIVLGLISRKMKVDFSLKVIIALFIYYFLIFIIGSFSNTVADLPDTKLFSEIIVSNNIPYTSLGVKLFYILSYPQRIMSFFTVELFIVLQIFIFILSLMILWKSWQIVLKQFGEQSNTGLHIFLFLSAVYPAFILYIPVPLREYVVLLGFSVMTYGLIDRYYNAKGILPILLGSLLLIFARPHLIIVVIIFLAIFQKNYVLRMGLIIGSFVVIPMIFTYLIPVEFSPEYLSSMRERYFVTLGSFAYGRFDWHTYIDILLDMPTLLAQFLLSPLPILHDKNPFDFFAILLDMLFSIFIYICVLYAGFKISKVYIFIFLLSAILFSVWEFYIFGAVRHRMPLVAILLPVASYAILIFRRNKKGLK